MGEVLISNPLQASRKKLMTFSATQFQSNDTTGITMNGGGFNDTTSALSGFKFYPRSGNFTGSATIYGMLK